MKIIGIIGSPRKEGNTDTLVKTVLSGAAEKGAETKVVYLNQMNIKGCQACMYCRTHDGCAIKDDMQGLYDEIKTADALVIGSPVYMFNVSGQTKLFLDRLYPFLNTDYTSKVKMKSALVYTQGTPDGNAFLPYLNSVKQCLDFLAITVQDIIVDGGNLDKNDVKSKSQLLQKAKLIGSKIVG